jgi:pilus assembly protein CpaB
MNKNRLIAGLLIAITVALLLSVYVYRAFQRASAVRPVQTQQIVVAVGPLGVGSRLDDSNIKTIPWPADNPLPGAIITTSAATGRALITPVVANEPILDSKLAPREAGAGLSATIPEGMRGVSVAVNDVIGVAGFVGPGTSVDVLVTGTIPGASESGATYVTRTILENIRVLAAGQKVERDVDGKPQTVPVVTLLVSPQDAATLTMASTEGKIQLALRNTIDVNNPAPVPVLQAAVFSPTGAPQLMKQTTDRKVAVKAAAPVPAPYSIEIIVGDKRETKSFPSSNSGSAK